MTYGGYPKVALSKNKEEVLESIFDLYLKKDLIEYLKIEKIQAVKKLIEYLAVNNAKKLKYEELSAACSLQHKEVKEFIELLRAKPGALNFGSPGTGSAPHLASVLFQQMTGTNMVHVPYKGDAPAIADLLAGQIQKDAVIEAEPVYASETKIEDLPF